MQKIELDKSKPIAFIFSPRLGDSLIAMVVVNNLVRNGYDVHVYSDFIYGLRDWFPWAKIFPAVKLEEQKRLEAYSVILHMYDSELVKELQTWHPNSIVLANVLGYKARISMVDIQVAICREAFGLADVVRDNNLQPLPGLKARGDKQRIIFHPTSSAVNKDWPKNKFIKLAQLLKQQGYVVYFIVAQNERAAWLDVVNYGIALPEFPSLSAVAAFIYEAAFFIGNDSGIGHLASNLGVPTVSIILRKGVARQWRPSWAPGEIVLSPSWLNPRPLKEVFWKYCISVKMVLKKFNLLRERVAEAAIGKTVRGKINDKHFICYEKYFSDAMRDFLHTPDYYLENSPGPFFKSDIGDTTTIGVVVIGGKEFVVKRYNIKSVWHFLAKCWRKSKAKKSWDNVHYLHEMNIATVIPVAMIEQRHAFFMHGKAYFVSEYVRDGIRGCDYFSAKASQTPNWEKVMKNIVAMLQQMYQAKIEHKDLQWGNMLIVSEQPLLLDLDHMQIHKHHNRFYQYAWQRDVEHFKKFLTANPLAYELFSKII